MKKRILSMLLAIVMLIGLLPVAVFADSVPGTITENTVWNDGDVINSDVTISGGTQSSPVMITVNGTVTVNAAITITGHVCITGGGTLQRGTGGFAMLKVDNGGSLTTYNVTIDGNTMESSHNLGIEVAIGGSLVINEGTVLRNHTTWGSYGSVLQINGTVVMNSGIIENNSNSNYGNIYLNNQATFTMNGGIIRNNKLTSDSIYGGGAIYVRTATFIMNGGSISGHHIDGRGGAIYCTSYGKVYLNGGTITDNSTTDIGDSVFYSCQSGSSAELYIGGDPYITDPLYLDATKHPFITSAVKQPVTFELSSFQEGRVVAKGTNEYALTESDMSKITLITSNGTRCYAKLDPVGNQLLMTQLDPGYTEKFYINYLSNGGTGTVPTQDATAQGGTFTVPDANGLTKDGYTFSGWNDGEKTYAAGDTYTMPAKNVTFTAQWEETVARYDLWVGGVQVTSANNDNLIQAINDANNATVASGGISYDPDTNTLTLNNFSYEGAGHVSEQKVAGKYLEAVIFSDDALKIQLVGDNVVTHVNSTDNASYGIAAWEDLTVAGTGTLTATGGKGGFRSAGLYSFEGDVTIAGGSIIAHGKEAKESSSGILANFGSMIISGGEVTAQGQNKAEYSAGLIALWDIMISGAKVNATAGDADDCSAGIFAFGGAVKISGGTVTAKSVGAGGMGIAAYTIDISGGVIESCGDLFGITCEDIPTFTGEFVVYAGDDAGSATEADASADATYANKHVKIVPAYIVTYKADGKVVKTVKVEHGKDATAPVVPAKEGYTGKWEPKSENITANTEINAVYTINQYTITFNTDGGSKIAAITQDYGTAVTAPEAPTKTGYTFAGWNAEIPATMLAENMTIKANWTANKYTITFDTDGGSEIKAVTQDYGTAVTAPADPTKTGYTFAGWNAEIPTTMPAENVTIKAKWTVNQYTVTYKADDEVVDTVEVEHGQDATAPEIPAKTGYTAVWSAEGKNITADTEINAVYTANKYTVTFKADGKVVKTVEVEHGKDATAPEIPAKTGYTAAWSTDGKNITADTEINAVYTVKKYTVTYKADGKVVKTVEVEHGKDATAPEIPAKEGYNETAPKWDKDGKNITADTTINAVYTKNQPGTFTSITPTTNAGGGKITDKVHKLKEKIPFTQEEALQIEYGADVEVWLEVEDISASVPADDKKEIEKKLGDGNVALYLDIAMFKQVGENEASRLTQLSDKVQITFQLPDSYINTDQNVTRTYSIIHVHDGKAEIITPVFDAATKTLTFETDRFSTYGVVYTDEKITPPAEETVPSTEKPTPPTEIPATGDSFQPAFWIACMTLSIFGIAVLLLDAKRRHAR